MLAAHLVRQFRAAFQHRDGGAQLVQVLHQGLQPVGAGGGARGGQVLAKRLDQLLQAAPDVLAAEAFQGQGEGLGQAGFAQHHVAVSALEVRHAPGVFGVGRGGADGVHAGADLRAAFQFQVGQRLAQPVQHVVGRALAFALAQRVLQGQVLLRHIAEGLARSLARIGLAAEQMARQLDQLFLRVGVVGLRQVGEDGLGADRLHGRVAAHLALRVVLVFRFLGHVQAELLGRVGQGELAVDRDSGLAQHRADLRLPVLDVGLRGHR
ncbi:hypothetical protein D9M68_463150 [compost metagenome]